MPVKLDATTVIRNLNKLSKQSAPEGIRQGLGKAGLQLMNDAVLKAPSVPLDESPLQASGSVFVQDKIVGTSESYFNGPGPKRGDFPTPAETFSPSGSFFGTTYTATVIFNKKYALRVHEGTELRFQQKKGTEGAKYLESKVLLYRLEYFQIVVDELRKWLRR